MLHICYWSSVMPSCHLQLLPSIPLKLRHRPQMTLLNKHTKNGRNRQQEWDWNKELRHCWTPSSQLPGWMTNTYVLLPLAQCSHHPRTKREMLNKTIAHSTN